MRVTINALPLLNSMASLSALWVKDKDKNFTALTFVEIANQEIISTKYCASKNLSSKVSSLSFSIMIEAQIG